MLPPDAPRHATCSLEDLAPPPPNGEEQPEPLSRESFHEVFFRKRPRLSAADHAGYRYEYMSWCYRYLSTWRPDMPPGSPQAFRPGRGAEALWALCSRAFAGGIPESARSWFLGGRLIALRKPDDSPSQRRLRPIAIGSVLGRAISMVAAHAGTSSVVMSRRRHLARSTPTSSRARRARTVQSDAPCSTRELAPLTDLLVPCRASPGCRCLTSLQALGDW